MKRPARLFTQAVLVFSVLMLLASCLDPLNFDPENPPVEIDVHGTINTTDVTAAVLLLSNQSKTVDVTRVAITQYTGEDDLSPEELLSDDLPLDDITTVIMFENEPQRLSKKAKYLSPSETSYIIDVAYKFYYRDNPTELEGEGSDRIIIPLPLPRLIVEVFLYRSTEGVVFVTTDRGLDFDVNDTGNPIDDTLVGQGSVPAVIPPENRSRMATFIVVNWTRSQVVDSVRFQMGQLAYTMGAVNIRDKQSIALGQGSWETTLSYRRDGNGGEVTVLPSINSIIVPSNDPQTTKEHYLYFYLSNRGRYQITESWPPGDESADDILPPDKGHGRGVIKIENRTFTPINAVVITNLKDTCEPLVINYAQFDPPVPILKRTTYIDVVGTADFPIDAHNRYQIVVQTGNGGANGAFLVRDEAFIKDNVVEIIIDNFDEPPLPPPPPPPPPPSDYGAGTIRIINDSGSVITNTGIFIKTTGPEAVQKLWQIDPSSLPGNPLAQGESADVVVAGIDVFSIEEGVEYLIMVTATADGMPFTVDKTAELKDQIVEITITAADIPITPPSPPPPPPPPPDYGGGTIRIINQTDASATSVAIRNTGAFPMAFIIGAESFDPPGPVTGPAASADLTVIGSDVFPIVDGDNYIISVRAVTTDGRTFTVTNPPAILKDQTVEIYITSADIPPVVDIATSLAITVESVTYDNTADALTPIASESTGEIIVRVSGFANAADASGVGLSIIDVNGEDATGKTPDQIGLEITGLNAAGMVTADSKTFTLTVTLRDTQAFATGKALVKFGIVNNSLPADHYILSNTVAANITIIDGQATGVQRAIPVTPANYAAFNTYAKTSAGLTRHYRQTENITLPGVTNNWTAIKGANPSANAADRFSGSYDGGGNAITGININQNTDYQGMFGYIDGATVKNLTLASVTITSAGNSGSVVGYNDGGAVQECSSTGTIDCTSWDNGGIVGFNNGGTVQGCSFSGTITGSQSTGGVVGNNDGGTIQNCNATGDVFSDKNRITDTYSGHNAGGVVGKSNNGGMVINCRFTTGTVKGDTNVGGVVGRNESGTVGSCQANGVTVTGTGVSARFGGVVGWNQSTVTGCSTGGGTTPGSVVGVNDGTMTP